MGCSRPTRLAPPPATAYYAPEDSLRLHGAQPAVLHRVRRREGDAVTVQHPVSPPADRPLNAAAGHIIRRNGAHTTRFNSSTHPALRARALVQCTRQPASGHASQWQRKQRACLRRTVSSCLRCPVCGGLVARLCAARKHCRTGHEQAEALARSLVTRPLRVLLVSRFLLTRGRDGHGDTPGVGVALVGCPGSLVCVTVCLCCFVVPRLAALRCGSSARTSQKPGTRQVFRLEQRVLWTSSSRAG